ncbi:AraC-like DNA-binding protein [Lacibacter cauensis]|uniref:AraC-like DNA-binding protein n=1 Tax=Lacibacter cauensis TaxID=510947 RepID=A0A562SB79_9BACT|nr:AraC family transcriptional regulator [Lacibacter cauensis]TWI77930.1 AraC-like DNA-binding protein [Lacibacter cauensis]
MKNNQTFEDLASLNGIPGIPRGYSGPVLTGADHYRLSTGQLEIFVQELIRDYYSIRLVIGNVFAKFKASNWLQKEGLYVNFMLQNGVRKNIDSIGKLHIRPGYHSAYYTKPTNCSITFDSTDELKFLGIYYSPELLEELVPYFPDFKKVIKNNTATFQINPSIWTIPSLKKATNELIECPYSEQSKHYYFDLKVREVLYQLLELTYRKTNKQYNYTSFEVGKIHTVKSILENSIDQKPPTIKSLAKKVAINEFKLKTGFRQLFHSSLFEFITDQKMHFAHHLLLNSDKPIKEIAALVGYPLTTNFITAFRKKFGYTPGSLRRS